MIRFIPLFAVALALAPATARASDPVASSKCDWVQGVMRCVSSHETPYSKTTTVCGFGATSACKTWRDEKTPPDPYSTRIMDGHGPR